MPRDLSKDYKYQEKLDLEGIQPERLELQKIECPACAQTVAAENLNIHNNIAKCNNCDGIFSFSNEVAQLSTQKVISQEILQPEGVEVNRFQDELDISVEQPWGSMEIILVSLLPLIVIIATGIIVETFPATDMAKIGVIAMWISSMIAYISYFFIRKKHKTYVSIYDDYLHIARRPKKFIRDKHYPVDEIDQVYTKSVVAASGQKGFGIFMIVNAVEGQKHVKLIQSVNSRSKAKYIEQEIEKHLGITDRRVPDEEH